MQMKLKHLTTATNIYLTYSQLSKRIHNLQNSLNVERLKSLNKDRKLYSLNKSIELHQRFMMLIKENSTPKLHELVKVAISSKRSLEYIISKIVDSVDGIYNPHSSEDDKDLAFIILQFGGPGLLDIVHIALNFPSTSTAYRILKNSGSCINSSVNTPMNKFVDNISTSLDNPFHGYMLEIDETYTEVKARWNPGDNKLYGICYEDLTFTSYDHVEDLSNMLTANILHVQKETMVIACSSNSINSNAQVAAALLTCSKNEIEYQANLIDSISTNFAEKHGAPLLNWSTDGDPARRQVFDSLMSFDLDKESLIYPTISRLRLIDRRVGRNEETVNFDSKHIVKRVRSPICNNFKIGE